VNALSRIVEDASRTLAPIRAVDLADDRVARGRRDDARVESFAKASDARFIADDVELLGQGGGRGRPVISVPFSAFFAQHQGQHPEARNPRQEANTADAAYRDAADLGVVLDRPEPIALSI